MPGSESPSEHLRNALQLLAGVLAEELRPEAHADLAAALGRMDRALTLLERRGGWRPPSAPPPPAS